MVSEPSNEEASVDEAAAQENGAESELKSLSERLAEEQSKSSDYWDRLLRKEAEFQNIQRRAKQDVENAHKFALESFAKELLMVLDTFERGVEAAEKASVDMSTVVEGMLLTHKMLLDTLHKFQIIRVGAEHGTPFDPAYHQAICLQPTAEVAPNTILSVMQHGYLIHGRLLRPAHVVVSKALEN